jgi:seryl-tRNA synthetase
MRDSTCDLQQWVSDRFDVDSGRELLDPDVYAKRDLLRDCRALESRRDQLVERLNEIQSKRAKLETHLKREVGLEQERVRAQISSIADVREDLEAKQRSVEQQLALVSSVRSLRRRWGTNTSVSFEVSDVHEGDLWEGTEEAPTDALEPVAAAELIVDMFVDTELPDEDVNEILSVLELPGSVNRFSPSFPIAPESISER